MPSGNRFAHQVYSSEAPTVPYELLPAAQPTNDTQVLHDLGSVLRSRQVDSVYLVHGTFAGTDSLGLIRELERFVPSVGTELRRRQKSVFDAVMGDVGNFSNEFADQLSAAINDEQPSSIPVQRFHWTGENLHLARANAAVRLLAELLDQTATSERRFLLWGHSHAGNVFALLTNLVGGDEDSLRSFFAAGESVFNLSVLSVLDASVWNRVRRQVLNDPQRLQRIHLDIVAFGTPIRYGWESNGYESLLHVIHHRPAAGTPEYRVPFPRSVNDLMEARCGDYVQQMGIAGTNFTPYLPAWRSWIVERRFRLLLQPGIRARDTLDRLLLGQRVPGEGRTLLVHYPDDLSGAAQLIFGHAIYTRPEWLSFHAQLVHQHFAQ
jgi:hypothetical protein